MDGKMISVASVFLVGLNPSPQSLQELIRMRNRQGNEAQRPSQTMIALGSLTLSIAQRSTLDAIKQLIQCKLLIMSLVVALDKWSTICTTSMAKHLFLGKAHSILLKIQISWMLDRNHQKDNHSFHSTSTIVGHDNSLFPLIFLSYLFWYVTRA